jgi:phospholipid N-methyltransferase
MTHDERTFRMIDARPRFNALRTRHEDGTAPRAVSAYQLFQTPAPLAARMVDLADIRPAHAVLEPSAGLGRILCRILARKPASVVACDISPDCTRELYDQFPGVTIIQGDFLQRRLGVAFDRIVMNPPFHMRSDIKHTLHALTHLAPGGVLVGLCMSGHRREELLRPLCHHWETIPAGAFRDEGTGVETILFCITKPTTTT